MLVPPRAAAMSPSSLSPSAAGGSRRSRQLPWRCLLCAIMASSATCRRSGGTALAFAVSSSGAAVRVRSNGRGPPSLLPVRPMRPGVSVAGGGCNPSRNTAIAAGAPFVSHESRLRRLSAAVLPVGGIAARRVGDGRLRALSLLRGGGEGVAMVDVDDQLEVGDEEESLPTATATGPTDGGRDDIVYGDGGGRLSMCLAPLLSLLSRAGGSYSAALDGMPILTKSVTAGIIFGLSDLTAQRIESGGGGADNADSRKTRKRSYDWTRIVTASLVGLLYFGPAAHAWYEAIFKIFPSTTLLSTLYKAFWGQVLFGPSFTCIFFATSLLQAGDFTLSNWFNKIRKDLPGAWAAGLGFWPIVDFVSYSVVPPLYIPLFVNVMSFIWTIYLSIVANRAAGATRGAGTGGKEG